MVDGRDLWWHDTVDVAERTHEAQAFDAEHPLYVMYTSGTTGKPKGILHTSAGYLLGASWTQWEVFDLKPETDVYWTAADIGWVTGHSYVVYGPLANATTCVIYEGAPDAPHRGRWWEIVERYGVSILYCAPTAIRTFMKWGADIPAKYDLSSLRLIGSVGEPINPEAYVWYREHIGGGRTPVVDTWWQTETGSLMISPLPGVTAGKPGAAMQALPGIGADVVDDAGDSVPDGAGGYLVLTEPWPSMLRTIWGDDERYKETYWSRFPGKYFAGDGAKKDADGDLWLLGRVDDVMNVAGHRLSTTEIESALVANPKVAEAAVVGAVRRDDRPGRRRVRDPARGGRRRRPGGREGAARLGREADRQDRPAPPDPRRRRAAEDPLRQDHAPPAARRRREPRRRRRHDARRHDRDGHDPRRHGRPRPRRTERRPLALSRMQWSPERGVSRRSPRRLGIPIDSVGDHDTRRSRPGRRRRSPPLGLSACSGSDARAHRRRGGGGATAPTLKLGYFANFTHAPAIVGIDGRHLQEGARRARS